MPLNHVLGRLVVDMPPASVGQQFTVAEIGDGPCRLREVRERPQHGPCSVVHSETADAGGVDETTRVEDEPADGRQRLETLIKEMCQAEITVVGNSNEQPDTEPT